MCVSMLGLWHSSFAKRKLKIGKTGIREWVGLGRKLSRNKYNM